MMLLLLPIPGMLIKSILPSPFISAAVTQLGLLPTGNVEERLKETGATLWERPLIERVVMSVRIVKSSFAVFIRFQCSRQAASDYFVYLISPH
jgi:hypothetical protein